MREPDHRSADLDKIFTKLPSALQRLLAILPPTLLRYVLVGCIATVAHYGALITAVELHWLSAPPAAVLGAVCGAIVAYLGNHRLTFSSDRPHHVAVPRFVLVACAGALANGGIVWAGIHWLNLHYLLAQVAATLLVLLMTYTLNRRWTFA